jgi:hypothetical protein
MTGALSLLAAAVMLVASALAWTGRWRAWSRRVFTGPLPLPITLLPGLGLALIGAGLYEFGIPAGPLTPLLLGFLALFVLYLWAPSWWGPAWFREEQRRGIEPDLSDPATALSYGALTSKPAGADSRAAVAERFGGREPIRRWRATWIEHENGGEKPHALGRAGATEGRLELYDDGLAFRASGIEDRMRREATAVAISRGEFGAARVVPAGAGPDGRKRPRHAARSAFARLVVDTQYGPFLFEVNGAKRKAREISETLGSGW